MQSQKQGNRGEVGPKIVRRFLILPIQEAGGVSAAGQKKGGGKTSVGGKKKTTRGKKKKKTHTPTGSGPNNPTKKGVDGPMAPVFGGCTEGEKSNNARSKRVSGTAGKKITTCGRGDQKQSSGPGTQDLKRSRGPGGALGGQDRRGPEGNVDNPPKKGRLGGT